MKSRQNWVGNINSLPKWARTRILNLNNQLNSLKKQASEAKFGYMDKVDFDCELGNALGGNKIFPSIEDLKDNFRCLHECGIVKVKVTLVEVVQEENFSNE